MLRTPISTWPTARRCCAGALTCPRRVRTRLPSTRCPRRTSRNCFSARYVIDSMRRTARRHPRAQGEAPIRTAAFPGLRVRLVSSLRPSVRPSHSRNRAVTPELMLCHNIVGTGYVNHRIRQHVEVMSRKCYKSVQSLTSAKI